MLGVTDVTVNRCFGRGDASILIDCHRLGGAALAQSCGGWGEKRKIETIAAALLVYSGRVAEVISTRCHAFALVRANLVSVVHG